MGFCVLEMAYGAVEPFQQVNFQDRYLKDNLWSFLPNRKIEGMVKKVPRTVLGIMLLMGSSIAAAEVPHIFSAGDRVIAEDINENFNSIDSSPPEVVAIERVRDDGVILVDLVVSDKNDMERLFLTEFTYGRLAVDSSLVPALR